MSGYSDCTIGFRRISKGEYFKILYDYSGCVYSVVFSRDGDYLASRSGDNTIRLWRISLSIKSLSFLHNFFLYYILVLFSIFFNIDDHIIYHLSIL